MPLYYKQESYDIIGAALRVYNNLGSGFLEAVYQEALAIEFDKSGIPYEKEKELKILYNGIELKQSYKTDFLCYDSIVVELKAVSLLEQCHKSQVLNYLHATKSKLGFLINFGNHQRLDYQRIVL